MKIIVYGKSSRAPCKTLRYLLDKKNLVYDYVEADPQIKIYPTVDIDGQIVEGANWGLLNTLLSSAVRP